MNLKEKDQVSVLVNGLGSTPQMELFIVNNRINDVLKDKNIEVYDTIVGEYMTSIEMAGFSISILKLDEEMKSLYSAKADTISFKTF